MKPVPIGLAAANAFVSAHHRHSGRTPGHKWSVGVSVRGELVGVVICGRPKCRALDDGFTAEVLRVCVKGGVSELHACSNLYGRAIRTAREMGYTRVITYTLVSEPGTSLRAAGFELVAETKAEKSWDRPSRRRATAKRDEGPKNRWERAL